jgi:hypothetical protein
MMRQPAIIVESRQEGLDRLNVKRRAVGHGNHNTLTDGKIALEG